MTDLEMVRLCAEAMDIGCFEVSKNAPEHTIRLNGTQQDYWPLSNDAQAMALVKKFNMVIERELDNEHFAVTIFRPRKGRKHDTHVVRGEKPLNRAIVACVAEMQKTVRAEAASNAASTRGVK